MAARRKTHRGRWSQDHRPLIQARTALYRALRLAKVADRSDTPAVKELLLTARGELTQAIQSLK